MAKNVIAKRILSDLDNGITPRLNNNTNIVTQFIDKLSNEMKTDPNPQSVSIFIMHGGSAYEGLAVKEKVHFDIIVCLEKPFVSENFILRRDPNSGYFTLQWQSHITDKRWANKRGCLDAVGFQEWMFTTLTGFINEVQLPNTKIECRPGLAALEVLIETEDSKISIDLAPQIPCHSWGQCPDLIPLQALPTSLRRYVDTLNKNESPVMFFSPAATGADRHQNGHQLCNVSFSQLEKKFLTSNTDIRDMVRLVKFVADRYDWKKKYAMKSFYVKRVAIKYADKLESKNLWNGYRSLLGYLSQELNAGTIDGYFVKNQVTYRKKPEKIAKFQREIDQVTLKNAREIQRLL